MKCRASCRRIPLSPALRARACHAFESADASIGWPSERGDPDVQSSPYGFGSVEAASTRSRIRERSGSTSGMRLEPAMDFGLVNQKPPTRCRRSWSAGATMRRPGHSDPRTRAQRWPQPCCQVRRCSCQERSSSLLTLSNSSPSSSPCRAPVSSAAIQRDSRRSPRAASSNRAASARLSVTSAGADGRGGFTRAATSRYVYPSRCACLSAIARTRWPCRTVDAARPASRI